MNAEQVRRLAPALESLPSLAQSWLLMREALGDIVACCDSTDMGQAERLAFIRNLAASALSSLEKP